MTQCKFVSIKFILLLSIKPKLFLVGNLVFLSNIKCRKNREVGWIQISSDIKPAALQKAAN